MDCYQPGGMREGQDLWQKKKTAKTATLAKVNNNFNNIALAIISDPDNGIVNVALAATSDFRAEAVALSAVIMDLGVTSMLNLMHIQII